MLRFVGVRLVYSLILIVIVSALVFTVTEILPGNVAHMILGTDATPQDIAMLEKQLGLDRSALTRLGEWLAGMAQGDFGESLRMQRPITPILLDRLVNSLSLTFSAVLIVIIGGFAIGLVTAMNHGSRIDRVVTAGAVIGTSLPEFVTGTLLVILFAGGVVRIFPPSGYEGFKAGIGDALMHLTLPAITLATILAAYVGRITRTAVIDALKSDYVRTAHLKGLSRTTVVVRHVLPNALIPAATVLFMNIGWMFGGIVVVEQIFVFPGIGRLMLFAVSERDWPLIQACAVVIASFYVLGNLVGDLVSALLNPRIRESFG
jgi:peptide/nickel transport system permease protein